MPDVPAALITGRGILELRDVAAVPPGPGCVTVDISLCGICGTDVGAFRTGRLHSPAVCGHEWVGTVAEIGAGTAGLQEGQRVVGGVVPACGRCPECLRGLGDHCRTASMVARGRDPLAPPHGGFARSITVEAARLVPAHPGLTDVEAAQVEPATVAFHGVRRSGIRPGDTVVVQGAGSIGLLAMQLARAAGADQVLVVEPAEDRRALAVRLEATGALTPEEAGEHVRAATQGLGADVVIECSGVPRLLETAAGFARAGGVVSLLSFHSEPAVLDGARWLAKELTLVASNAYTRVDFAAAMEIMADGRVKTEPLHSRTVGLAQLARTLEDLAAGRSGDIKVLVDPRLDGCGSA